MPVHHGPRHHHDKVSAIGHARQKVALMARSTTRFSTSIPAPLHHRLGLGRRDVDEECKARVVLDRACRIYDSLFSLSTSSSV